MCYDMKEVAELIKANKYKFYNISYDEAMDVAKYALIEEVSIKEAIKACGLQSPSSFVTFSQMERNLETSYQDLNVAKTIEDLGYASQEEKEKHATAINKFKGKTSGVGLKNKKNTRVLKGLAALSKLKGHKQ